ncbi:MAG: hypothetical protein WD063_09980, partial [Pirellulales bacterium]
IGMTALPTANTFTDPTVAPETTYYYRVRAFDGGATSEYSNEIEVATPAPPAPAINFPNGFAGAAGEFSFNGPSAAIVGTSLQLTDGGMTQAASVFALAPVSVAAFATQFDFLLLSGTAFTADGITFTIQNAGLAALGAPGGGLGYAGIGASVAVKFDLYDNTGEGPNSTGLQRNGSPVSVVGLNGTGIDLHSGHVFSVNLVYDGSTLGVTISDTVTLAAATQSYTIDIPAVVGGDTAYVGFTGATGGLTAIQRVLNWTYSEDVVVPPVMAPTNLQVTSVMGTEVELSWINVDPNAAAVIIERKTGPAGTYVQIGATVSGTANTFIDGTVAPQTTYDYRVLAIGGGSASEYSNEINVTTPAASTPAINFPNGFAGAASGFRFNGPAASIVSTSLQLTDGGMGEAASIFALAPVSVAAFATQFDFQLLSGTAVSADGITFTIQNAGLAALGTAGGGLGYVGIGTSVAVKFDLYDNTGEGPNSTGLYLNGAGVVDSMSLAGTGIDLHSGHVFSVSMAYDGSTLDVTIIDTVTLATAMQSYMVDIPAIVGGDTAYVGFTGATGGLTAIQRVLNWTYDESTAGPPASSIPISVAYSTAMAVAKPIAASAFAPLFILSAPADTVVTSNAATSLVPTESTTRGESHAGEPVLPILQEPNSRRRTSKKLNDESTDH